MFAPLPFFCTCSLLRFHLLLPCSFSLLSPYPHVPFLPSSFISLFPPLPSQSHRSFPHLLLTVDWLLCIVFWHVYSIPLLTTSTLLLLQCLCSFTGFNSFVLRSFALYNTNIFLCSFAYYRFFIPLPFSSHNSIIPLLAATCVLLLLSSSQLFNLFGLSLRIPEIPLPFCLTNSFIPLFLYVSQLLCSTVHLLPLSFYPLFRCSFACNNDADSLLCSPQRRGASSPPGVLESRWWRSLLPNQHNLNPHQPDLNCVCVNCRLGNDLWQENIFLCFLICLT